MIPSDEAAQAGADPFIPEEIERLQDEYEELRFLIALSNDEAALRALVERADRYREALESIVGVGCRHPKPVGTCGSCLARAALAPGEV